MLKMVAITASSVVIIDKCLVENHTNILELLLLIWINFNHSVDK